MAALRPRRSGSVGGKEAKRPSARSAQRAEMALVKGEHVTSAVPIGEDDEGRIGQADLKHAVPTDDPFGCLDVWAIEGLEPVHAAPHLGEECPFRVLTHSCREQVFQLGENER